MERALLIRKESLGLSHPQVQQGLKEYALRCNVAAMQLLDAGKRSFLKDTR